MPAASARAKPAVSVIRALACQGLVELWLSLGVLIPPTPAEVITPDVSVEYVGPVSALFVVRLAESPDTPPPEGRV
ncbi:hypothetical protein [Botrimarina hoheduenensis]|nr:hypothetical protein [Botrimarina hoheduenensis]